MQRILVNKSNVNRFAKIISLIKLLNIESIDWLLKLDERELDTLCSEKALDGDVEFTLFGHKVIYGYEFIVIEDEFREVSLSWSDHEHTTGRCMMSKPSNSAIESLREQSLL